METLEKSHSLEDFLVSSPIFQDVSKGHLAEVASRLIIRDYPAGEVILRQGELSGAVYFLIAGRVAIRVARGRERETVAWLHPPDVFGELSFVTGRPAVADIEVVVDARVARLEKDALTRDAPYQAAILQGLTRMIAGRLQAAVSPGLSVTSAPVVLLVPDRNWKAPRSFAAELTKALQRETERPTLLVEIGNEAGGIEPLGNASIRRVRADCENLRSTVAAGLRDWSERFQNVVMSLGAGSAPRMVDDISEFANWRGILLGSGSPAPHQPAGPTFMVQDAAGPALPQLDGLRQLIADTAESETRFREGREVTAAFQRTTGSIARLIAGTQVGVALGGGAAWGWAHIGVLQALEEHGIPVDVIAGSSMGGVIGALRATGRSIADLIEISEYWRTRTRRFVEWRVWRLCLLNERMVYKTFREYFGDRRINQTEVPFWTTVVDIQSGSDETLLDWQLWQGLRGSVALPGLLPPLACGDRLLVDASVMDPVPIVQVREMGAHFAIAVNAMVAPAAQKLTAKYPLSLFEIMTRSVYLMGHSIGQGAAEKAADIVLTPNLADVSILQFKRCREIIAAGRIAAEENIPAIQALYQRLRRPEIR